MSSGDSFSFRLFRPKKGLPRKIAFTVAFVLAVAFLILDRSGSPMTRNIKIYLADTLAPVVELFAQPVYFARDIAENVEHLAELREENETLRAEVAALRKTEQELKQLRSENTALRRQLNFVPEESFGFIAAPVIADGAGAFVRSVLVKAGKEDGVRKGQAVISGQGLIGRVDDVGQKAARVILVEDLNSRIPVMLQQSRLRAMLAGNNTSYPELVYLPEKSEISAGEEIVTSGDGGVFPQGLQVGLVKSVSGNKVAVQLHADMDNLDFVKVVDYGLTGLLDDSK